jgi:polyferredoxin
VLIGVTLLAGPFFCGWLCPFGALQDLFGRLGPLFGIKKAPMPRVLAGVLSFSRYVLLANVIYWAPILSLPC